MAPNGTPHTHFSPSGAGLAPQTARDEHAIVKTRSRRRRVTRSVPLAGALIVVLCGADSCDSGRRLEVDAAPVVCGHASNDCFRAKKFVASGSGFPPSTAVRVYFAPPSDQPHLQRFDLKDRGRVVRTTTDGRFSAEYRNGICATVPEPDAVPRALVMAVDDESGNRLAATVFGVDALVCQPPFSLLRYTQPCGTPPCPTLTTDSPNIIGVHWGDRENRRDHCFVRYRTYGDPVARATVTRELGDDVGDVAINNLTPGIVYEFELAACDDVCDDWFSIGSAATR